MISDLKLIEQLTDVPRLQTINHLSQTDRKFERKNPGWSVGVPFVSNVVSLYFNKFNSFGSFIKGW